VRCLRAENSTAPCARCSHIGAPCVTGTPGHPGRPRKPRLVDDDSRSRNSTARPAAISSSGPSHVAKAQLDGVVGLELAVSNPDVHVPKNTLAHGSQPDLLEALGDSAFFLDSQPTEQSLERSEDILALVDQLSSPPQLHGLPIADDDLDAMLHIRQDSRTALDMNIDPLLGQWAGVFPTSPPLQYVSSASSLMRFREEIVQRIMVLDAYFSDPVQVLQGCKEEHGAEAVNPAALLLKCSNDFIDIIQSFTPATRPMLPKDSYPHNQPVPPNVALTMHMPIEDTISTEIVLLALSGYLALMRLYDSLFHCIYKFLCQMPPESFKSIKVKSVLRVGDISSLQDMPLKTYATGILDVIRDQVRTLERCMGVPSEYCLSGEVAASHAATAQGIFSRADRARLFCAAMALEDVNSRRGNKLYVESIRASIQDSMVFLDD
jgi:hypothetical protein